ncbi:hypothetical protein GYH30_009687 [Glycine max]|uniref:Uncharacterized protein n=2 Tax=Glycine subgen. Soja TaxID=1462606 RepID=A0A0R0K7H5_SOYBN|nr:hypothetical protein GYH30_009687 [Glycine max]RZC16201.1 Acetolactate synthase small subunit 1, chloroplastic [Glycine soja]
MGASTPFFRYLATSYPDLEGRTLGDVYPIEPPDGFTVNHVLDAHWGVLNEQDVNEFLLEEAITLLFYFIIFVYKFQAHNICVLFGNVVGRRYYSKSQEYACFTRSNLVHEKKKSKKENNYKTRVSRNISGSQPLPCPLTSRLD